ncbi:hypothetical protein SORBI_3005G181400 [Sorghum bicolor]|uniref:Uncharacterized protein n=1 Tax=Sorghum bicolor TaxID=4558 RepID=A0A1B6PTB1_SORBI|nr:hypothetical protein SORBI_3005G181400 [Sorghum bicolor]
MALIKIGMGRIVCLMACSFLLLVIFSSNSATCQSCFGGHCPPCFRLNELMKCNSHDCRILCEMEGHATDRAFCNKFSIPWKCCCPRE